VNNELKSMLKEAVPGLRYSSDVCLEGIIKITKNVEQLVCQPRFERSTSRIKVQNVIAIPTCSLALTVDRFKYSLIILHCINSH
jgi:hypothetical protein